MSAVAPGWKLRVLLAQALFGDPDILLLDEPTNNLDINTHPLARRRAQRAHEHDGDHLARPAFPLRVCTHMADVDYGDIRVYPGNYDDYMQAVDAGARSSMLNANAKAKERIADLQDFVRRFSREQVEGAPGDLAHEA